MRRLGSILFVSSLACGPLGGPYAVEDDGCAEGCETNETTSTTGGETTGTTTTSTDDWDDDGSSTNVLPTTDMPSIGMCDIWDPDDCPEGEKCTGYATMGSAWDANKCVPVMGDQGWLEPCQAFGPNPGVSGLDDCAKGYMCWDIDADDVGFCQAFCIGSAFDPQCPNEEGICMIYANGVIPMCYPTCDPLALGTDCANPDNLCVSDPGGRGFFCTLDASGGVGTYGTECQYAASCNHGLFCAAADSVPNCQGNQGCCSEFCEVGQLNTCAGKDDGQECVPWWEMGMAPDGYEHVGGCAIPE